MGNCNQNFQDVGDLDYVQHFEPTNQLASEPSPSAYKSSLIDQQAIHNTLIRKEQESPNPIVEEVFSKMSFPPEPQVISISEPVQTKVRPKLEELDLAFYHKLGLPDYEYPPFPEEDKHLFEGVETYELKDNYGVKYVGEWLNSSIHGNGVLLSNTAKYIGQFKLGLKHYHGRQILRNQVYEGQFEGGRRKGMGVRYTEDFTQKGQFDDEFVQGEVFYLDGRIQQKNARAGRQQRQGSRPEESFRQDDELNKTIGSLYTDKYYEDSELPADWYEQEQRQRMMGLNRDNTSNNKRSMTFR